MKKAVFILFVVSAGFGFSQNTINTFPSQPVTNGQYLNPRAYVGIGTFNLTPYQAPNQNLHIHGRNILTRTVIPPRFFINPIEGPIGPGGGMTDGLNPVQYTIDYGYTAAIALTNQTSGTRELDGAIIRLSQEELAIENLEENGSLQLTTAKTLRISNPSSFIQFNQSNRSINVNQVFTATSSLQVAAFNIAGINQGAMQVRAFTAGQYGLSVVMPNGLDNALQVFQGSTKNFTVNGGGEVFGRKFTTTLNNIPDYVFQLNYPLLSFSDLRAYIANNKHLPNIPSAQEIEAKNGEVDLGEMNRLLLEKVEELTLYILQLEERMKVVEETKK